MFRGRLDSRAGGVTLVVGYGLLVAVLFRNPASAIETATATAQGVVFLLVLPVLGLASGLYAYRDGPYQTVAVFLTGSYLAAVGVTLALFVMSRLATVAGLCLFVLATVSLVVSLRTAATAVGLDDILS